MMASVTPAVVPNCSRSATMPVPASSTPTRSGTNLNATLMTRFVDSKTRASTSVGGISLTSVRTMYTSATAATWKAAS